MKSNAQKQLENSAEELVAACVVALRKFEKMGMGQSYVALCLRAALDKSGAPVWESEGLEPRIITKAEGRDHA